MRSSVSRSTAPTTGASSCLSAVSPPRPPKPCGRLSRCTQHPGIPGRMGPEIATTYLGVLTDVVGFGLDGLHADQVTEILAVHPRGDFKNEFLHAYFDGFKNRPETTNGTVNSDVLEHFIPGYRRTTTVYRIIGSAWPS